MVDGDRLSKHDPPDEISLCAFRTLSAIEFITTRRCRWPLSANARTLKPINMQRSNATAAVEFFATSGTRANGIDDVPLTGRRVRAAVPDDDYNAAHWPLRLFVRPVFGYLRTRRHATDLVWRVRVRNWCVHVRRPFDHAGVAWYPPTYRTWWCTWNARYSSRALTSSSCMPRVPAVPVNPGWPQRRYDLLHTYKCAWIGFWLSPTWSCPTWPSTTKLN